MITKHEVTNLQAVNITCDDCGAIAVFEEFEYDRYSRDLRKLIDENPFCQDTMRPEGNYRRYVCPNCGKIIYSNKIYPYFIWLSGPGEPMEEKDEQT